MRFEVDIEIGGALLADDECGTGELARLMQVVAFAALEGRLAQAGDEARLLDLNGTTVGFARMIPDWTPGEVVWVTTDQGSLLKSTISRVGPADHGGYRTVETRYIASHELLAPVIVDHRGLDQKGRPVLARVP